MKRICKAANPICWECMRCHHSQEHEQTPDCFVKCCNVDGKDVRCVVVE